MNIIRDITTIMAPPTLLITALLGFMTGDIGMVMGQSMHIGAIMPDTAGTGLTTK